MYILEDYDKALRDILSYGKVQTNKRTGQKTRNLYGVTCRYNIKRHFPLLTRRKLNLKSNLAELLWFLEGSTNLDRLKELGCGYWEPWRDESFERKKRYVSGALGPIYGFQLRNFGGEYYNGDPKFYYYEEGNEGNDQECEYGGGFDQLLWLVDAIKKDPSDRGLIVNLWNPQQLDDGRLRPCAYSFQVLIDDDGLMTGVLIQRSADWPVGVPFNLTFYAAFMEMLGKVTSYIPYELVHQVGSAHIYENQIPGVEEYLGRAVVESPTLLVKPKDDILSYNLSDFELRQYYPLPPISFEVAV